MEESRLSNRTKKELTESIEGNLTGEEMQVFDDPIMGWWSNSWVNWDEDKGIKHKPNSKGKG